MTRLLFVADGPRDGAVVPSLIERLIGRSVESIFRPWKEFRVPGGYRRKLKFAVRLAQDIGATGVVATVDSDADRERDKLRMLIRAREEDRASNVAFPMAVGEANPHLGVWLLDDFHAVRTALGLEPHVEILNIRRIDDPKAYLNRLIQSRNLEGSTLDWLKAIAASLILNRCAHAAETGFQRFADDTRSEFQH